MFDLHHVPVEIGRLGELQWAEGIGTGMKRPIPMRSQDQREKISPAPQRFSPMACGFGEQKTM